MASEAWTEARGGWKNHNGVPLLLKLPACAVHRATARRRGGRSPSAASVATSTTTTTDVDAWAEAVLARSGDAHCTGQRQRGREKEARATPRRTNTVRDGAGTVGLLKCAATAKRGRAGKKKGGFPQARAQRQHGGQGSKGRGATKRESRRLL